MALKSFRQPTPWKCIQKQRFFLDRIGRRLSIVHRLSWKDVFYGDIITMGGQPLLEQYSNSVLGSLQSVYPELAWHSSDRSTLPKGYWKHPSNCSRFLEQFSQQSGVARFEDWQGVHSDHLIALFGQKLLHNFGNNLFEVILAVYPHYLWDPLFRALATRNGWASPGHQLQFLTKLALHWGVRVQADWRSIDTSQFREFGGKRLLDMHQSLVKVLYTHYPLFHWDPNLRRVTSREHWKYSDATRNLFARFIEKYRIGAIEDWYRISNEQVYRVVGKFMDRRFFCEMLSNHYRDEWIDIKLFSKRNKRSEQRLLLKAIGIIFPGVVVCEDYRHPSVRRVKSGVPIELDVFVPSKNLAFEYQGKQHFVEIPKAGFANINLQIQRDKEKKELCEKNNITLISIPFHWDQSLQHLKQIIHQTHPSFEQYLL